METLVIRLSPQDEIPSSWLVVDAVGNAQGSVQSGPLSDAAPLRAGRRVRVLAPGAEVLIAEPELPIQGGARLAQVVPFALEEQLAEDIEDLHFAIGKRDKEGRPGTPVAVVNRALLDGWLARLRVAGIETDALYVETQLLPDNPGQAVVLLEDTSLYLRHPQRPPVVLQTDSLVDALELSGIFPGADGVETPAIVYLGEADWERHGETLEIARERLASLNVQILPGGALTLLAREAVLQSPINLLQGEYAAKAEFNAEWRRWRLAAILFGALIGLNLLTKGVELWRLKQTERTLDAAIEQTFREAMPGQQNATNARRRMEARLTELHGSGGGDNAPLLNLMGTLSDAVSQVPETGLEALNFRGEVMDLRVAARDVSSLDRLQGLLKQQGLTAELQSSNARGSGAGVEGRLQIKGSPTGSGT